MPPKGSSPASTGPQTTTTSTPARTPKSAGNGTAQDILQGIYDKYVTKTPQRVKLLDTFMAFLVVVGALQFFYVVLVGNFVRVPSITPLVMNHGIQLEGLFTNYD
jgi:oligosaccharyltransferase complex subunit epsilon